MTTKLFKILLLAAAAAGTALSTGAHANPDAIRATLPKLLPQIKKIDDVAPAPVSGLWSVRVGGQMLYTNADGTILIEGQVIDLKARENLTQSALTKALALDFDKLPLKDAFVALKSGKGERKLGVFADPSCGYCKRFESDLAKLENVTVYVFPMAILGPQSEALARNIVCAKEPGKAWHEWMMSAVAPAPAEASCDSSAVTRNMDFAAKNGVTGTPTTFFTNRDRAAGALPLEQLKAKLDAAGAPQVAKR